jgi:ribonuclease BN (tRNA processing enzyme)
MRYGGNTSCVILETQNENPIALDMGTGMRVWGQTQPLDGSFVGSALITHLHFDHVQGLPFFAPADRHGARLDVFGPAPHGRPLGDCFDDFCRPPYFPISVAQFRGDIRFHARPAGMFSIGSAEIMALPVPHVGDTFGYRITSGGATIAYISDHQQPLDGSDSIAPEVLELCEGADLVIHDAQYTPSEWSEKAHWGHCTIDYAMHVATSSRAKAVALFHHDPSHTDNWLDDLGADAIARGEAKGIKVYVASEGLELQFGEQ